MKDTEKFDIYKKLKEDLCIKYKGYDLKYAMSPDFVFHAYKLAEFKVTFSNVKFFLFHNENIFDFTLAIKSRKVLFTSTLSGKDHMSLMHTVCSMVENGEYLSFKTQRHNAINIINIIISFFQVFINLKASPKIKLYFFFKVVNFKNYIDMLESIQDSISVKAYVAMMSGGKESILSAYFKKRNVKTFCLQHGLHASSKDFKYFIPADFVSIENLNADHMLAWGAFTREALLKEGYPESAYMLAGNPKYSQNAEITVSNDRFDKCIICLARDIYSSYNLQLLSLAGEMQENGFTVFIKLHPRSDISLYETTLSKLKLRLLNTSVSIQQSIEELNPDFVIVYNSTVYYEYYINNIIAFRYSVYANDIPFGLNDEFSTMDELNQRIETFKNRNTEELNTEINAVIGRFCALGVNNYAEILNNI